MHIVGRRVTAVVISGVACFALGICSMTLGGRGDGSASFLLFLISLPWTLAVYVLTMVFNVTSPIAIGAVLGLATLAVWFVGNRLLLRAFVSSREP